MKACALFFVALGASAQVNFYSLDQEQELGLKLSESVFKASAPTSHADVRDYVQRLGEKIAAQMPAIPSNASGRKFLPQYRFAVIVEDSQGTLGTHEPVVLPGGYIFVSEQLVLAARDETEFAGMLAHAMAHVSARHATRLLTRGEIAGWAGVDVRVEPVDMLAFRREFESEADTIGAKLAWAAGFDPSGLITYLERTQVDARPKLFSNLPSLDQRVAKIQKTIGGLQVRPYSSNPEFNAIQHELR